MVAIGAERKLILEIPGFRFCPIADSLGPAFDAPIG